MAKKTSDLTIIILTYNSQYWLKKTLQTLWDNYLQRTNHTVEVIVVDNNSQDESVSVIKKDFSWVKLLESEENIGFSAGNNLALKDVTSPYVMLLNSDMECTPESNFDILIDYLVEHPTVGIVTPLIRLANKDIDLACHRGEPTPWASISYFMGLERLFPSQKWASEYHQLYKGFDTIHEVDACSGAAMMVRTLAIKKVGLLDERFFMYAEDLDWCKRFRDAGFEIVFNPEVEVIHHKYKSGISSLSRQTATKTKSLFYDTMLQYYDKHYQNRYPFWVRPLIQLFVEMKKGAP